MGERFEGSCYRSESPICVLTGRCQIGVATLPIEVDRWFKNFYKADFMQVIIARFCAN